MVVSTFKMPASSSTLLVPSTSLYLMALFAMRMTESLSSSLLRIASFRSASSRSRIVAIESLQMKQRAGPDVRADPRKNRTSEVLAELLHCALLRRERLLLLLH